MSIVFYIKQWYNNISSMQYAFVRWKRFSQNIFRRNKLWQTKLMWSRPLTLWHVLTMVGEMNSRLVVGAAHLALPSSRLAISTCPMIRIQFPVRASSALTVVLSFLWKMLSLLIGLPKLLPGKPLGLINWIVNLRLFKAKPFCFYFLTKRFCFSLFIYSLWFL